MKNYMTAFMNGLNSLKEGEIYELGIGTYVKRIFVQ